MLDDTYRSALGGSGGSGGLGYIYYEDVAADEIADAFNRGIGGHDSFIYYPGAVSSYYVTAAGGGAAGVRVEIEDGASEAIAGGMGTQGIRFGSGTGNSISVERKSIFWGYGSDIGINAEISYFWADHHGYYSNEFLFGNLQFIPALSHWNIDTATIDDGNYTKLNNFENADYHYYCDRTDAEGNLVIEYDKGTVTVDFGGVLVERDNFTLAEWDQYALFIKTYIDKSPEYNSSNDWKVLFRGGSGGTYNSEAFVNEFLTPSPNENGEIEIPIYIYLAGGTPYTSEIYGYITRKSTGGAVNGLSNDQFFFSRNDMVTSGGYYGTAQGLSSPARTALA